MQERTSGGETAGKQYPLSGGKAEAEGKPGQEPHCQGERDEEIQVSGIRMWQGQGWPLYTGTPEVDAEGEGYAQKVDTAKSWEERATGYGRSEAVHARLAELLCYSFHEEYAGRVERLAAQKNPHVHLEAMEETTNQVPQFAQTRHPGKVRMDGGNEQAWLLVHRGNRGR